MPNLEVNIDFYKELENLEPYKYSPNGIFNVSLNRLRMLLNGEVDILEPSNPFTYLLETSCLNTVFAIKQYLIMMKKLYPRLANNEEELYLHMSDVDYLGRFSEPCFADIIFTILLNDFDVQAVDISGIKTIKIPRHYTIKVDTYYFTLPSAIIIRKYPNGVYDVKYEDQNYVNIFPVTTNHINFSIIRTPQNLEYMIFKVNVPEVRIETEDLIINKGRLNREIIGFDRDRSFYTIRAFREIAPNTYDEILITHTDSVYDINTPTLCVKVLRDKKNIECYVPYPYVESNLISGKLKVLIYTTKGYIDVNFNDYKREDFGGFYKGPFPSTETDSTTAAFDNITKNIFIEGRVFGGKNELSFDELKRNIIENSIGDRKLPITSNHLSFYSNQLNFRLIRNVDVITNRIFLIETDIIKSKFNKPLTKSNMDIIEIKTNLSTLKISNNVFSDNVVLGPNTVVLKKGMIIEELEDRYSILSPTSVSDIYSLSGLGLIQEVNNRNLYYLFYNYIIEVIDDVVDIRAYDLDDCKINNINFKSMNENSLIGINTIGYDIIKTNFGYRIGIMASYKKYDNSLNESLIRPYIKLSNQNLYIKPDNSNVMILPDNRILFRFDIHTNEYVDKNEYIKITNFVNSNDVSTISSIQLETEDIDIIYVTPRPNNYLGHHLDSMIANTFIQNGSSVVSTHEVLNVRLGTNLEYLYKRLRVSAPEVPYQVHTTDVPMTYDSIVYDQNNNIIHYPGDIVYDQNNNIVYKHRAGDPVLDQNGNPIPLSVSEMDYYVNLLVTDLKNMLATSNEVKTYMNQVREYLTRRISIDAKKYQEILLENTIAYVIVPKNMTYAKVIADGSERTIKTAQSFKFKVYVDEGIYNNQEVKEAIINIIITELDNYLSNNTVIIKTEMLDILYNRLKEFVLSIEITKFTDLNNVGYIRIKEETNKIGINKILTYYNQEYDLKEDVDIEFILAT
ncbi:MAG: hypothetical protein QXF12_03425 [Candidatus Aenigmatarchaeota archaeon]